MAYKNDTEAKQAFIDKILTAKGFDAHLKAEPADIVATKDGETWYITTMAQSLGDSIPTNTRTIWDME